MTYSVADFDYELPTELIAQYPKDERDSSRLMRVDRNNQQLSHHVFHRMSDFIQPNDVLVINNTKVIPARLFGCKQTGGAVEVLIERVLDMNHALAHIRASKAPKAGVRLHLEDSFWVTVTGREGDLFKVHYEGDEDLFNLLDQHGHMPLPPYIERSDEHDDRERYQTVFAKHKGAVAAPTASLHFTDALLQKIRDQGTTVVEVTLHVGAGTFQPVRVEKIEDHHMHQEWAEIKEDTVATIKDCQARGGRVIAVGTTVMRVIETAARSGGLNPYKGETDIFITPGFEFHCVDGLLTNFHLPQSTLLMLVAAFAGMNLMQSAYQEAIAEHYRFFSYGDAMLIL